MSEPTKEQIENAERAWMKADNGMKVLRRAEIIRAIAPQVQIAPTALGAPLSVEERHNIGQYIISALNNPQSCLHNHALESILDYIERVLAKRNVVQPVAEVQLTKCAVCGQHKHTPLRRDETGGYVCLTCVDKELDKREKELTHMYQVNAEQAQKINAITGQRNQFAKDLQIALGLNPLDDDSPSILETVNKLVAENAKLHIKEEPAALDGDLIEKATEALLNESSNEVEL